MKIYEYLATPGTFIDAYINEILAKVTEIASENSSNFKFKIEFKFNDIVFYVDKNTTLKECQMMYNALHEKRFNDNRKKKIKMKKTLVMSAFPASGKTFAYNKYKNSKIIFDSDSSEFSWIKDEFGNNTKERNPDFPNNYIQHIKDNLGKADIIFISSHLNVRQAMKDNDIDYITIYPSKECRLEWVGRMHLRGNDDKFISFINDNWDNFMFDIKNEPHGTQLWTLEHNQYIENCLVDFF